MSSAPPTTTECALFDCVQVNLAVLADRWHGPDTHRALGAVLRFTPKPDADGLPTVEPTVADHLADAERLIGVRVVAERRTGPGEPLRPAPGHYVVSDAYHLPWLPYAGHRHMEHSFLLEGDAHAPVVLDGYHNETPWGSARPLTRSLTAGELAAAVPGAATSILLAPSDPPRAAVPELDLSGGAAVDAYVAAYAEHPDRAVAFDRLTLQTWLLARSRKLHARFLADRDPAGEAARDAHVRAWEALAESVYIGYRRVARGRPEPTGTFDRLAAQLHADHAVFGATAGPPVPAATAPPEVPAALREKIAHTVAEVLGTDAATVLRAASLADLARFTSFRVVEIIERLEQDLSVECAADDLVPENLHHLDGIGRIVHTALRAAPEPVPARIAVRPGGNR
ncbi:acyl carrier protein [Streptomyces cyaneofuscatus]|uniref:acyl carrier protein n=1 Tax=Streptomyces cyaneofuscatus TaxID=66883 RepID=UPI00342475EA